VDISSGGWVLVLVVVIAVVVAGRIARRRLPGARR
jgi:hypothetical protein